MGWKAWLRALVASAIAGGAGAVTSAVGVQIVIPDKVSGATEWLILIGWMFTANAILHLATFLQKSPLPDINIEAQP